MHGDRGYLFSHNLFPLAFLEVEANNSSLNYQLLDSVESTDYSLPPFRIMQISLEINKTGKIASLNDAIGSLCITQAEKQVIMDSGEEGDKLVQLTKTVKELDPDIIVTSGGDSYLFSYLIQRATLNNVLDKFTLSRDNVPFVPKSFAG